LSTAARTSFRERREERSEIEEEEEGKSERSDGRWRAGREARQINRQP